MVVYFVGIDGARFKRPVEPGDQLILEASSTARVPASTSTRPRPSSTARSAVRGRADVHDAPGSAEPAAPAWRDPPHRHRRPAARTGDDVEVGPYSVIGAGVRIGDGTVIGAHCVIEGPPPSAATTASSSVQLARRAPQDMKYRGEPTELEIGDRNTIREFCTFNRGTAQDAGSRARRRQLDHGLRAPGARRAGRHHTILANNATLAGHVHVGDWAIVGGLTGVHQFVQVGAHAMTGFQSHVAQDVPPFMTVAATRWRCTASTPRACAGAASRAERIARVKQMHRLLYRDGLTLEQARAAIAALCGPGRGGAEGRRRCQLLLDFLAASTRGIVR
jgi:UDP-N-acetylglucosamine acyltransferase